MIKCDGTDAHGSRKSVGEGNHAGDLLRDNPLSALRSPASPPPPNFCRVQVYNMLGEAGVTWCSKAQVLASAHASVHRPGVENPEMEYWKQAYSGKVFGAWRYTIAASKRLRKAVADADEHARQRDRFEVMHRQAQEQHSELQRLYQHLKSEISDFRMSLSQAKKENAALEEQLQKVLASPKGKRCSHMRSNVKGPGVCSVKGAYATQADEMEGKSGFSLRSRPRILD